MFLFPPRLFPLFGKQVLFPLNPFPYQLLFRFGFRQINMYLFHLPTIFFHLAGKPPGRDPDSDCATGDQCNYDKQIFHHVPQKFSRFHEAEPMTLFIQFVHCHYRCPIYELSEAFDWNRRIATIRYYNIFQQLFNFILEYCFEKL